MPEKQEYEYRVEVRWGPIPLGSPPCHGHTPSTDDPATAGGEFRQIRGKLAEYGGRAELQRRPVGEWETVEAAEHPGAPGG